MKSFELNHKIAQLLHEGELSITEITRKLNCGISTVVRLKYLKTEISKELYDSVGGWSTTKSNPWTPGKSTELQLEIAKLLHEGELSMMEIARKLNCSYPYITNIRLLKTKMAEELHKSIGGWSTKTRTRGKPTDLQLGIAKLLAEDTLSHDEIAEKLGCSVASVRRVARCRCEIALKLYKELGGWSM